MIQVLDRDTINQIAAGEVVERPMAVVKELVENSLDAGATAITIEVREGGISFIRVTDNGVGIDRDEIRTAFLRHATSKIRTAEDLLSVNSLGFRGEALSSIAAVAKAELITKTADEIAGTRYEIWGGEERIFEEVGCPDGTTFIVKDLFYNTPARRKFLKTKTTEGNYIQDLVLRYSLSHADTRFHFIVDGKSKLQTSGDGELKTNIFYNYGADVTKCLLPVDCEEGGMTLRGFIGKPELSRGNRTLIHYFVNGRYIKSPVITSAIEHAYKDYLMSHRYPFVALMLTIDSHLIDVNVHPTKMEIRFQNQKEVYDLFYENIRAALGRATLMPEASFGTSEKKKDTVELKPVPEPFEKKEWDREEKKQQNLEVREQSRWTNAKTPCNDENSDSDLVSSESLVNNILKSDDGLISNRISEPVDDTVPDNDDRERERKERELTKKFSQMNLMKDELFVQEKPNFRIIGQVFGTYWLVEYQSELLIIDQHAAHEKVLYEKLMKKLREKEGLTQNLIAPIVVTLSGREMDVLREHAGIFEQIGFQFESFGDREYIIQGVPADFLNVDARELFLEILDSLMEEGGRLRPEGIIDHCATMACKAAVKGNNTLSFAEADSLISQMLMADKPYHCPHGRPTTIVMTKYEFEKKFKRII